MDDVRDQRERQYREFIRFVRGIEANIENLLNMKNGRVPFSDEDELTYLGAIKCQELVLIEGCRKLKLGKETE